MYLRPAYGYIMLPTTRMPAYFISNPTFLSFAQPPTVTAVADPNHISNPMFIHPVCKLFT